ncbi:hypothetical protein NKG95_02910 [Mesorhizobium sp. M1423]|uniref:hypothetical protein n=1 Tax=Mesorhizobium sp. M1423 TaxID=2957101 RepID=UPI003335FBE9
MSSTFLQHFFFLFLMHCFVAIRRRIQADRAIWVCGNACGRGYADSQAGQWRRLFDADDAVLRQPADPDAIRHEAEWHVSSTTCLSHGPERFWRAQFMFCRIRFIQRAIAAAVSVGGMVVGLLAAATLAIASISPDPAMTFQLVRNSDPTCEPVCPEWIYAHGSIEPYSPPELRKLFDSLGSRRLPILIESNGGDRRAAEEMGRMLRKRRLTTGIGLTSFEKCTERLACQKQPYLAGKARFVLATCISACPLLFAGGLTRLNSARNVVAVHIGTAVIYTDKDRKFQALNGKRADKILRSARIAVESYLVEMGVKAELEDAAYAHEGLYVVPFAEQKLWNLTTGTIEDQDFTKPQFCKIRPLPESCVSRAGK